MTEVRALADAMALSPVGADLGPVVLLDPAGGAGPVGIDPWLRSLPAVTIAIGSPAEAVPGGFDIVTDETRARVVADAVEHHPSAAVTLAQLLRMSEGLEVADALVAESLAYSTLQSGPEFQQWLAETTRPAPDTRTDSCVRLARIEDHLRVTLDRPERRNAYSAAMRDELIEGLALVALDPTITGAVLDGAGVTFCAGGDLSEFGTSSDPATAHRIRTDHSGGWALHTVRDRLTVRMHGPCVGAGVELPAFAHHVVADPRTTFRLPEVAMGLVPGAGGTVAITRRLGRRRLLEWALTGETVDAETALDWGLVDELGPVAPAASGQ